MIRNDDAISARLIFPVVACICTSMLVGERISRLVSRVARIGVCTAFLYLLVVLEVFDPSLMVFGGHA